MFRGHRRSAMKVRGGRAQRKNRTARTPHYLTDEMPSLVIDRRRPGRGYRHIVRCEDVRRFIELLPNWSELSEDLNAIVLDRGDLGCMGWYRPGVVAICAWERSIEWEDCYRSFHHEHAAVFEKLGIPTEDDGDRTRVRFTINSAKAFLLTHVLVHEFGHHHDRLTTRSRRRTCRGESYAEGYARRFEDQIIEGYRRVFPM